MVIIIFLLGYCNRQSLNPFAPDCNKAPDAAACKKNWSAPGLEL